MSDPATEMAEAQVNAYKSLSEITLREAEEKVRQAKSVAQQEHFKAAIWGLKFEEQQLSLACTKDAVQRAKQMKRPCMTLGVQVRPEPRVEGTIYVAAYGMLEAEGETPEIACANFDRMWVGGDDEL